MAVAESNALSGMMGRGTCDGRTQVGAIADWFVWDSRRRGERGTGNGERATVEENSSNTQLGINATTRTSDQRESTNGEHAQERLLRKRKRELHKTRMTVVAASEACGVSFSKQALREHRAVEPDISVLLNSGSLHINTKDPHVAIAVACSSPSTPFHDSTICSSNCWTPV